MLAAKGGFVQIVRTLCLKGADVMKKSDGKKTAIDYAQDEEIKRILNRAKSMNIAMSMSPLKLKLTGEKTTIKQVKYFPGELRLIFCYSLEQLERVASHYLEIMRLSWH